MTRAPRNGYQKINRGFPLLVLLAAAALLCALPARASSSESPLPSSSSSSSLLSNRDRERWQISRARPAPTYTQIPSLRRQAIVTMPLRKTPEAVCMSRDAHTRLLLVPLGLEGDNPLNPKPTSTCNATQRRACALRPPWPLAARGPAAPSPPGSSPPAGIMLTLGAAPSEPCMKPH